MQKLRAKKNFMVHNLDVLSLLFGSLLGDSWAECRNKHTKSVRFILQQENSNMEYLHWYHKYLSQRGYCSPKIPKKYLSLKNKVRYYYKISTYSFSNIKWLYDEFYYNRVKRLPRHNVTRLLLTPLAIAVWFMDDGSRCSAGVKIATNGFEKKDLERIKKIIKELYSINTQIQSAGKKNQFIIYIPKSEMPLFSKLIKPYMISSMYYKLNGY